MVPGTGLSCSHNFGLLSKNDFSLLTYNNSDTDYYFKQLATLYTTTTFDTSSQYYKVGV